MSGEESCPEKPGFPRGCQRPLREGLLSRSPRAEEAGVLEKQPYRAFLGEGPVSPSAVSTWASIWSCFRPFQAWPVHRQACTHTPSACVLLLEAECAGVCVHRPM